MTDTFSEGDLIEATKGENIVRGRLTEDTCAGDLYVHGWCIKPLLRDGYTVTLIEKAAPALPTEPGLYRLDNGMVVECDEFGAWMSPNGSSGVVEYAKESSGFTRLEPVPLTAAKVINRVRTVAFGNARGNGFGPARLDEVAREFGVTE